MMTKENNIYIGADLFVKGKTAVFFGCSIVSAFINLVFISNLTKSPYTIGTLFNVPAALLLGFLSIWLDVSKALHAVQINTLKELERKLSGKKWVSNIRKLIIKWTSVYLFYVLLSVITSVSLSSISIGEGIHRNQNTINTINKDISKLQVFLNTDETSSNIEFQSIVQNVANSTNAIDIAQNTFNKIQPVIEEYRKERADFPVDFGSTDEIEWNGKVIIPDNYWNEKNNQIIKDVRAAGIDLTLNQIRNSSYQNIQQIIKNSQQKLTSNDSLNDLQNLSNKTTEKYRQEIKNLENKYTYPDYYIKDENGKRKLINGEKLVFDENNLSGAIAKLEDLRVKYENDNGDIGSSSKIFMQLGSTIDSKKSKTSKDLNEVLTKNTSVTSFGTTEIFMMGMLLFLSLLCELAINQFAPKVRISRRMLDGFSQYFPKDFNIDAFMKEQEKELISYGIIQKKEIAKNNSKKLEEALISFEKDLNEE